MRKASLTISVLLLMSAILLSSPRTSMAAPTALKPPGVHAQTAAMIDVQSGRLIYSYHGDKQMRIASLTKIMTAIVAIEHGNLSDQVKVSKRAYGKEGSSIYLRLGEEMSLHHLLYGLMLRSGNDAATAIAEHVGGSVEGFAYLMNEQAKLIGMEQSHFMNPHGLDESEHYSTANDLARLTAYALNNPVFRDIVKTKVKKVPNPYEKWDHVWMNKNKMLSLYDGADGVKTGYTKLSLRCLVSSATRDDQQIAVVTLNDGNDWADHSALLNYGFQHYPLQRLIGKGEEIAGLSFVAARSISYPMTEEEAGMVTQKVVMLDEETVPYRFGERGKLNIYIQGKQVASVPIVEANSTMLQLQDHTTFMFNATSTSGISKLSYSAILTRLIKALFYLT